MKNFFSIQKFKDLSVLFILEILIGIILGLMIYTGTIHINLWDWRAFGMAFGIWLVSAVIEYDKYNNMATMIGVVSFMYFCWLFIFQILFK